MGRTTSTGGPPQNETTKTHFSHPHPLRPITLPHHQTLTLPISCSGCNLKPSGTIYSCTTCNYFLHKKCFDMPKKISHPFHKDHPFTLLPVPAYEEGFFACDACGQKGSGFSYHCKACSVDLHILCAAMPLSLTNRGHNHQLNLTFESSYGTGDFCCDICRTPGSNHWLYRCGLCGFDAHLNCARGAPPVSPAFPATMSCRSVPQPQVQQLYEGLRPQNVAAGVPVGGATMNPFEVNRQSNEMLTQAIQQMINNNAALTQAILAGRVGGGGGVYGGGAEMQQLMRMMSGLNNSGGFGGGGMDVLQSLMGGGSGLDFLGGGGLDFLGGAFGGLGL